MTVVAIDTCVQSSILLAAQTSPPPRAAEPQDPPARTAPGTVAAAAVLRRAVLLRRIAAPGTKKPAESAGFGVFAARGGGLIGRRTGRGVRPPARFRSPMSDSYGRAAL